MSEQATPFALRGWGIRVWDSPERFETAVDRALVEADRHGVNMLDLHDGSVPPGIGWVDLFAQYRQVQALRNLDSLTYSGQALGSSERAEHQERFRDMCRRIKAQGLRIHVWYHVLRDLPEEWIEAEPTLSKLEGRRLWQVLGGMVEDFFSAVPEVDALTVTAQQALAETVRDASSVTYGERLRATYQCLYEACKRHRKQLIVREVGATRQEKDAFIYAVGPLPPDITIMVKDVQGDWYHLNAPLNPVLHQLKGKNIIVESDLYGEHWGHLQVPLCRPGQLHALIRSWLHLPIVGAIGRIKVVQQTDSPRIHVFDTPNAANVATFYHLLREPMPESDLDTANLDAFDLRIWLNWLHTQYGEDASPYVIAALDRTPRICQRVFYLGGAYFQNRSHLPSPSVFERSLWPTFTRQAKSLGTDVLRWEKEVALRLVRQSLRDIEIAGPTLDSEGYDGLLQSFEQARDVALAYRAFIDLCIGRTKPEQMPVAVREAEELATRVEAARGEEFFGYLPERLRQLSKYMEDITRGTEPAEAAPPAEPYDDGPVNIDGLAPQ